MLIEGIHGMASEMIAEVRLDEILKAGNVRAQLVFMAERLLSHATRYRELRMLLQREAHKLPALRVAMRKANLSLASEDIIPWTQHALKCAGRKEEPTTFALIMFGAVLTYLMSLDRRQPAFGLDRGEALAAWADYWARELRPCSRRHSAALPGCVDRE